jgi:hypothetical protein
MKNSSIQKQPIYKFLLLLTIASSIGLQGWRTIFNNFAVEKVGINGFWIGVIQSVREVPGFIALFVVYILLVLREHRLSSYSILLLGFGVAITGFFPSNLGLIFTTFLMSVGFHYFETTNQSLTLQYFQKRDSATVMGRFRSIASLTNIGIGLLIWLLSHYFSYKILFLLTGLIVALLAIISLAMDPSDKNLPPQRKKMVLRKKYWLFYTLNFLAGARRQIFIVFAVFLLVKYYNFSVQMVTALFILNNLINYFFTPLIAKAINYFGERSVLSLEYGSLVFVFLAYAFINNSTVIAFLYILDNIFFNFSIGIKTYFQKTGDPRDIAPSMAIGFTINHIAAVVLPVLGGILWMVDSRIPFVAGAILSIVSFIFVQFIKIEKN